MSRPSSPISATETADDRVQRDALLFAWRGDRVVLLVERAGTDGAWIVARGWRSADRLTDVRRWRFAASGPMSGQVRRLVAEASGDTALATRVSTSVAMWAAHDHSGATRAGRLDA